MKRTKVNKLMQEACSFFEEHKFRLPGWAFWSLEDWKKYNHQEILQNNLGWDITDFGSGKFEQCGLLLITLRNGNPEYNKKTYAEKIMIVKENQETPMHFHWNKMEDIINRGGGNLIIELYNSCKDEELLSEPVKVSIDSITHKINPGEKLTLKPGQSICLTPGMYHRFYAEPGRGQVLAGEVSMVNDDKEDNRFHEPAGRFSTIDEDAPPLHLLVSDYAAYLPEKNK
jgi:D-lyxose ketol-isomerase